MSIIYSYPTSQPTVDDLLIGTDVADDNATKSFTVQSLVSLINAQAGSGTLTSTTISTDAFLTAVGNPTGPAVAYTIGLSALGTPSSTTFLRGDNKWVTPTVTSGISVLGQSASPPITTDLSQLNFTGAGVVTSSSGSGGVQVNIAGLANVVETIVASNGISVSSPTGNVIISNTGITGLVNGNGISISTTAAGLSTISVIGQTIGTVTSAAPGPGLSLISGTTTVNPVIGLDYTGADTYITEPAVAVPLAVDLIPFHSIAGDTVNKVAFGDIQASTLALLNTALTTSDANNVKNNTDTYTTVPITANVITLLDSEYTALAVKDATTLYLTTSTAPTTGTVQFTIVDTGISAGSGCGFSTPVTTCNPAFTDGTNLTNVAIGTTYTLTTVVTASGANCTFSNGSSTSTQVLNGTVTSGTTQVTQSLTGSISAPAAPGTVTDILNATTTGISGSQYTTNAPRSLSGTQGDSFSTSGFGYTATANAGYEFSPGGASVSAVYDRTTSYYGDNNTTGYFDPTTLTAVTYPVTYSVDVSGITDNSGNGYTLNVTGQFSGTAQGNPGIQIASGGSVTASVTAVPVNGTLPGGAISDSVLVPSVTSAQNISLTLTGTIGSNTGTASMSVDTTGLTGPSAGYTITLTPAGYTSGAAVSGAVGSTVNFAAAISLNSGYTATSPLSVVYNGNQGVVIPGSVTATISGAVAVTSTRVSSSCSQMYPASSMPGNCFVNRGATVWLGKSGGSASYPQSGDIAYSSQYGSGNLSDGAYAVYAASNAYMIVSSGSITSVTPCSP